VPEHVLHVVDRPAGFEEPGTGLMPQVLEMQVYGTVVRPQAFPVHVAPVSCKPR
jgi:hypothetical protein